MLCAARATVEGPAPNVASPTPNHESTSEPRDMAHTADGQQTGTVPRDFQPSPDAAHVADALRSGLVLRRQQESAAGGSDAARLTALGDLDSLGPVAQPGAAAPLVKLGRRVLLVFLRPWLSMQTVFNRELTRRFDESVTMVRDVRRRMPLVEDAVHALDDRLHALERGSQPVVIGATSSLEAPSVKRLFVQRLFVQSRLPPPPAAVLILAGVAPEIADDLAHLGYRVAQSSDTEADALVATLDRAETLHAMARMRPGERARCLLLTDPGAGSGLLAEVTNRVSGWRVEERLVTAGDFWSVVVTPAAGDVVVGLVLVRDRQADAPAR